MNRREYFAHFMTLLTGTASAQLVNLLSYALLARLYSPVEFGSFAVFLAVVAIPVAIACGRFDLAIPVAKPYQAQSVFWLCICLSVVSGLVSSAVLLIYFLIAGGLSLLAVPLIGLTVTLGGICASSTMLLLRNDGYRLTSMAVVARTLVGNGVQIGFGFVAASGYALMLGYSIGLAIQAAMLFWGLRRAVHWARPRRRGILVAFRRFRRQVTVDIPSAIIGATSLNLLTWFLFALYGPAVVGFYAMANRLIVTPLGVFNDTLSQVFFQKASRADRERGSFWPELKFNLLSSTAIAVALIAGILLFARPFLSLYLGEQWLPSADLLILIAPMLAARSISVSIATAVFVLRRPQWLLSLNIGTSLGYVGVFLSALAITASEADYLSRTSTIIVMIYAIFIVSLIVATRRRAAGHRSV